MRLYLFDRFAKANLSKSITQLENKLNESKNDLNQENVIEEIIDEDKEQDDGIEELKIYNKDQILSAHDNYVRTIATSNCNKFIITGSDDKSIKIWFLNNETNIFDFFQILTGSAY